MVELLLPAGKLKDQCMGRKFFKPRGKHSGGASTDCGKISKGKKG